MMRPGEIDAHWIAAAMSWHVSTVRVKASREGWPYREQRTRSRLPLRIYTIADLPDDVRTALGGSPDPEAPVFVSMPHIALALGAGRTTVQRRARIERWPYRTPPPTNRGRGMRWYRPSELPDDVRTALEDTPPPELPGYVRNVLERRPTVWPLSCSTPACILPADARGLCRRCRERKRDGLPPDRTGVRRRPPNRRLVALGVVRLDRAGISRSVWAEWHGWGKSTVADVVRGHLVGVSGNARRVALALRRIGDTGRIPDGDRMRAETDRRREKAGREPSRLPAPPPEPQEGPKPEAPGPRRWKAPIPEGHPSRYRILRHTRIPEWAREVGA